MSNEKSLSPESIPFRLQISGGFLLLASLTGFLCGGEALCAAGLAAAAHELGHLALILRQGNLPRRLTLDVSGACLYCLGPEPGARQELVRALAGPGAGALLWLLLRSSGSGFLRVTADMSLMLSLVNLLPAPGLDGGRVLGCLLPGVLAERRWERLSGALGILSVLLTTALGVLRSPQLFLYGLWLLLRQLRIRLRD